MTPNTTTHNANARDPPRALVAYAIDTGYQLHRVPDADATTALTLGRELGPETPRGGDGPDDRFLTLLAENVRGLDAPHLSDDDLRAPTIERPVADWSTTTADDLWVLACEAVDYRAHDLCYIVSDLASPTWCVDRLALVAYRGPDADGDADPDATPNTTPSNGVFIECADAVDIASVHDFAAAYHADATAVTWGDFTADVVRAYGERVTFGCGPDGRFYDPHFDGTFDATQPTLPPRPNS